MNFEKIVHGKLFGFFDWVWKLVFINTLTMVLSLGVVTFLPSFVACYRSIQEYRDGVQKDVFRMYFGHLKSSFKDAFFVGLLMVGLFGLFGFAVFYYTWVGGEGYFLFDLGFYISLFCLFIIAMMHNQLPMIVTYFHFRFLDNFKFAFFMTFKFMFQNLAIFFIWCLSILLLYLTPLWFFFLVSVPMFLVSKMAHPVYRYLSEGTNKEIDINKENNK